MNANKILFVRQWTVDSCVHYLFAVFVQLAEGLIQANGKMEKKSELNRGRYLLIGRIHKKHSAATTAIVAQRLHPPHQCDIHIEIYGLQFTAEVINKIMHSHRCINISSSARPPRTFDGIQWLVA